MTTALGLLGLSLLVTLLFGDVMLVDSEEYLFKAENLWTDIQDPVALSKRPPLYPFLLEVLGVWGTLLVQNIMVVLVFWRMSKWLQLDSLSKRQWWILMIFTVFSLNVFLYADKVMAEVLSMFALWFLFESIQKRKMWMAIGILAALPFIKPVFLFLPILMAVVAFFMRKYRTWFAFLLIPFALSLGYMSWNKHRTGAFEFSSIQHINALHYNKYQFDVHRFGADYAAEVNDSIKRATANVPYAEKVEAYNQSFYSDVKSAPFSYLTFHLVGAVRGVIDPGRFDLQFLLPTTIEEGFAHREGGIVGYLKSLNPVTIFVLIPIAVVNGLRALFVLIGAWRDRKQEHVIWALMIVAYVVGITGPINASRFMVPLVPFLIYLAVLGVKPKAKI